MQGWGSTKKRVVILLLILGLVQIVIFFVAVEKDQKQILYKEQLVHAVNHSFVERVWHRIISDNSGSFRVRFAPSEEHDRENAYPAVRIRLVGPQIKLLSAKKNQHSRSEDWIAYYTVECAGRYSVEIKPLYEAFYDDDIAKGKLLPQWPLLIPLQYFNVSKSSPTCQLNAQWRTRPTCNISLMAQGGSWIIDDQPEGYDEYSWDHDQITEFLSTTKIHSDARFISEELFEQLRPMSVVAHWNESDVPWFLLEKRFARLHYRPFACQFEDGQSLANRCVNRTTDKKVCFFGDSQTRILYNSIVELLEPENQECKTAARKEVCETYLPLRYIPDTYGGVGPGSAPPCRIMLINFGQWPISWVEDQPFKVSRYEKMVADELAPFANMTSVKVFWVSTNSMPMNGRVIGGLDWRTDPVFNLYNNAANRIAERERIPIVDIFPISSALNELSGDHAHFKDPVGRALASLTLNTICDANHQHK